MNENDPVIELSNWAASRKPSTTPEEEEAAQDEGGSEGLRRALYKFRMMQQQNPTPMTDDTELLEWWREHKTRNGVEE